MKESALQTKILKRLSNCYHVKIVVASTAGHPDIIACVNSKFVAIECKSDSGEQSELHFDKKKFEYITGIDITK